MPLEPDGSGSTDHPGYESEYLSLTLSLSIYIYIERERERERDNIMTHDITVSVLFLGAGAANSGLPVQSPSKHRKGTETNRYLAKGDFGSYSVL